MDDQKGVCIDTHIRAPQHHGNVGLHNNKKVLFFLSLFPALFFQHLKKTPFFKYILQKGILVFGRIFLQILNHGQKAFLGRFLGHGLTCKGFK